ncbi:MAG TPA: tetratricopeptide repeat protein [Anaeromyxobacteraceae bacterium]|nr:tetratricopeptide repeat protein [Anaeromyxobacteraceae bacterium]
MARAPGTRQDDEVEGLDEEFLFHLHRGGEHLARGELEAARTALTRARELRPRDPQALGLLGQALYRLGRFDEAADAYGRLVDESPVEAAARVNLGLASLKAKRHEAAIRQLEVALDLSPGHKKAMGYLGLAWLERGDFAQAREWFERAGSDAMVARCDELLALARPAAEAAALSEPQPEPTAPPAHATDADAVAAAGAAEAREAAEPDTVATFTVRGERLTVRVGEDVLARALGLLAARGTVRLVPEMKRFRGSPTERPFGVGPARVLRASGDGELVYRVSGLRLVDVAVGPEPTYFAERAVFAFEGALAFENGRVASRGAPDLDLVHLKGPGDVVLAVRGEVVQLAATPGAPVRVPLAALVGWSGALTPRIGALAEGGQNGAEELAVELTGEGRVLVDDGAALGTT